TKINGKGHFAFNDDLLHPQPRNGGSCFAGMFALLYGHMESKTEKLSFPSTRWLVEVLPVLGLEPDLERIEGVYTHIHYICLMLAISSDLALYTCML
ncbi:hypothetical protein ACJX0J_029851, partial [Zea mays]